MLIKYFMVYHLRKGGHFSSPLKGAHFSSRAFFLDDSLLGGHFSVHLVALSTFVVMNIKPVCLSAFYIFMCSVQYPFLLQDSKHYLTHPNCTSTAQAL